MLCGIFEYKTPISKVPRGLLLFSCVATSIIDEELGGTTPLEVILKFPDSKNQETSTEDDEFEDWGDEGEENDEKYWFTKDKIDKIASVHNY